MFESEYVVLFQITGMLLMPALLGRSIGRSLKLAPSRFSHIAIYNYYRAQRLIDAAWLGLAVLWFAYSSSATIGLGTVGEAQYLAMAVMVLLVFTAAAQIWTHRVMARQLGQTWSSTDEAENAAVQIDEQGYFQSAGRDVDPGIALICADRAITVHGSLSAFALILLFVLAERLGAFSSLATLVAALVLAGLWLSLRVLLMDLALDTWPGTATTVRLRRTYIYYVQVFEQWVIPAVLVSLLIVIVLGPLASLSAYVPATVSSFALWGVVCIVFAIAWNILLYRPRRMPTPLPFPMQVNRYSANYPVWAYFVTIIHFGMALCLGSSIFAMNSPVSF